MPWKTGLEARLRIAHVNIRQRYYHWDRVLPEFLHISFEKAVVAIGFRGFPQPGRLANTPPWREYRLASELSSDTFVD
jgi:hypothetical protein